MIRLEEALARARHNGRTNVKDELMEALWPGRVRTTQIVNFNNLVSGRTKTMDADSVRIICTLCGVSADWLFGLTD
ncbi:MAG: hypothetical protein J6T35_08795 [Bacteroidales bacterium]|nr:hypothetical protein [Bacteroidales bacterium]